MSALLAGTIVTLAVAVGGCGSGASSATSADPATATPSAVALYAGATVRPDGSLKSSAQEAGKALTHQRDPYLRLLGALQTPGSAQLDFERDVAPWLGPHAGVFLTSTASASPLLGDLAQSFLRGSSPSSYPFGNGGAQGAIVLDTSDSGKAHSFLEAQAKRAGAHAVSYRGTSYQATAGGLAFAVVDRFAVIGSESGVHAVIDTTLGAGSLAGATGYSKLASAAPADALGHVYVNPASGGSGASAGPLAPLTGDSEVNVSLVPSASSLSLDADTLAPSGGEGHGLLAADPQAAGALEQLPGESWLAIGLGHLGTSLSGDVAGLSGLGSLGEVLGGSAGAGVTPPSSTLGVQGLVGALTAPLKALGANTPAARRDYASWMGTAGIFATGASLLELRAAVVIESKNPALSRAAVPKLAADMRKAGASSSTASIPGTDAAVGVRVAGLPLVLDVANGQSSNGTTKFVLGLGEASVQTALNPSSTMAESSERSAAASALGEGIQPSVIVDFPTLLGLFETIGLTESPELSPALPYLRSLTTLAGGGHALGGGIERFRLVLGLQHAAG